MNRMYRKVMVEGEAAENVSKGVVPVVAKAYHLRVTACSFPDASRRNLSEGNVMAHILDHLAAKRYGQAADIAAQRYTALEAVNSGMVWERARFLELVGEDDNSLVGQHERALVAHEAAQAVKIAPHGAPPGAWNQGYQGGYQGAKGKGKGKENPFALQDETHGVQKGWTDKGQGKGKVKGGKGKEKKKW